jgi:hypothetical protein
MVTVIDLHPRWIGQRRLNFPHGEDGARKEYIEQQNNEAEETFKIVDDDA